MGHSLSVMMDLDATQQPTIVMVSTTVEMAMMKVNVCQYIAVELLIAQLHKLLTAIFSIIHPFSPSPLSLFTPPHPATVLLHLLQTSPLYLCPSPLLLMHLPAQSCLCLPFPLHLHLFVLPLSGLLLSTLSLVSSICSLSPFLSLPSPSSPLSAPPHPSPSPSSGRHM